MRVQIHRGIFDDYGVLANPFRFPYVREGRSAKISMTVNEEKHSKFFNEEAVLVQTMSDADLDEHIHELEDIAREAKARIMAASEEKRNRAAKAGNKAWRVEPVGPDPTVSDSLNKVKQRSARTGKLDKMRDKLAALGIPDSEIDQMVSKMVSQARKEPEALKKEAELRKELGKKEIPLTTVEERIERAQAKKELLLADPEAAKELEKHNKLLKQLEEQEEKKRQEGAGKLDVSTLKFT
jgi:hypothetical protein